MHAEKDFGQLLINVILYF